MSDDLSIPSTFDGSARLFPLPNVVLFPRVLLPLHIFEPRYRQMTADALAGDRLIALVLLQPGWEADYEGRPALHEVACLGRIVAEQQLADGYYNLLLRGLHRIRLREEVTSDRLYRSAHVELLAEEAATSDEAAEVKPALLQGARKWLAALHVAADTAAQLLETDMALGTLTDVLGFTLPLPNPFKQELLAELHDGRRARLLRRLLDSQGPPSTATPETRFPPEFSAN